MARPEAAIALARPVGLEVLERCQGLFFLLAEPPEFGGEEVVLERTDTASGSRETAAPRKLPFPFAFACEVIASSENKIEPAGNSLVGDSTMGVMSSTSWWKAGAVAARGWCTEGLVFGVTKVRNDLLELVLRTSCSGEASLSFFIVGIGGSGGTGGTFSAEFELVVSGRLRVEDEGVVGREETLPLGREVGDDVTDRAGRPSTSVAALPSRSLPSGSPAMLSRILGEGGTTVNLVKLLVSLPLSRSWLETRLCGCVLTARFDLLLSLVFNEPNSEVPTTLVLEERALDRPLMGLGVLPPGSERSRECTSFERKEGAI